MFWTSSAFRRITNCFNDSRQPEASLFFVDARDGTSRRCQVVARPSNAESAQKCQLVTPGFAAAVSTSGTHLVTKIPHLSAHRYPRNTCRILKSICQDAMHSVDTTPWYSRKMYCIFCHCSMTFQIIRGSNQCDIVRAVPSHLQHSTIWDGQRNDFNRQSRTK